MLSLIRFSPRTRRIWCLYHIANPDNVTKCEFVLQKGCKAWVPRLTSSRLKIAIIKMTKSVKICQDRRNKKVKVLYLDEHNDTWVLVIGCIIDDLIRLKGRR